ncbi:hypothetical protein [Paracoccus sulfuroxidans]|uniref:Uncharacterized protein n=1 Tax=Paracoccus sulfuroxidans TaxID=384678 RepID=A0A562NKN3_9RHOB|nr:hypothetical protein [Paracoccus sulfuroxidans]TWI32772.1 hypothetical protein IQ24_02647 [Paracoccus sulfuroxidans]
MSGKNDQVNDAPAFPVTAGQQVYATGMTLRDWFAGQALAALIQSGCEVRVHTEEGTLILPIRTGGPVLAYQYADAMLVAREATP